MQSLLSPHNFIFASFIYLFSAPYVSVYIYIYIPRLRGVQRHLRTDDDDDATTQRFLGRSDESSYYSDRGTCAKCYLSCHTCSGPRRDQCVKCPKDWQLADGECHPECPEGFFKSAFGCQKCHHICKTCSGKYIDEDKEDDAKTRNNKKKKSDKHDL